MPDKIVVVGCFIEYDGKFLILERANHKPQGGTWGLPVGKVDKGERIEDAVLREVAEETGLHFEQSQLELLGQWEFQHLDDPVYIFPTFRVRLDKPVEVQISANEHQSYLWVTPQECDARKDLIFGFHKLLRLTGYVKSPYEGNE